MSSTNRPGSYDLVKETMPENEDLCHNCRDCKESGIARERERCRCVSFSAQSWELGTAVTTLLQSA